MGSIPTVSTKEAVIIVITASFFMLNIFRLIRLKIIGIKKIKKTYPETVTQNLNCDYTGIFTFAVEYVFDCGRCYTGFD